MQDQNTYAALLTAVQEDYLEVIYQLSLAEKNGSVRITDIARELRTKLPTVTRTVRKLAELGLLEHQHRQGVTLTEFGRKMAGDIRHRHTDLVCFFTDVLGLDAATAERDACKIEHGFSPIAAERLHEFLEYFQHLSRSDQQRITDFRHSDSLPHERQFTNLSPSRIRGWRG